MPSPIPAQPNIRKEEIQPGEQYQTKDQRPQCKLSRAQRAMHTKRNSDDNECDNLLSANGNNAHFIS